LSVVLQSASARMGLMSMARPSSIGLDCHRIGAVISCMRANTLHFNDAGLAGDSKVQAERV